MNQYVPQFQVAGSQHSLTPMHMISELYHRLTKVEMQVQMGGLPPCQPRLQLGPDRQQRPFHNFVRNIRYTGVARPAPRGVRNANRNLNPCNACQSRKKKCKKMAGSPNICVRCSERGLSECHPVPRPWTQGHATEDHNVDNADNASMFPSLARGPTNESPAVEDSRGGAGDGHMAHHGTNMQGLSCAATHGRMSIKKESIGWDEGLMVPFV